jgi:putative oxidoreductase
MPPTIDLALLLLRTVVGGLLAGHGAQKLFGAYGGSGVEGTTRMIGGLGLQPARPLALAAGAAELGGGVLTGAGLFGPVGPLAGIATMSVATTTAHAGKPIWGFKGGAELPVTNITVLLALLVAGHGRLALDRLLAIHVPRWLAIPGLAAIAVAALAPQSGQGVGAQPADGSDGRAAGRRQNGAATTKRGTKEPVAIPVDAPEQRGVESAAGRAVGDGS